MKMKISILFLSCSLLLICCTQPQDPVARFILYMNKCLEILEKYKEDPVKAGTALAKYNTGKEKAINQLSEELKRYNKDLTAENNQAVMEKLKPVIDRMIKLIGESPTLLLDENVAKAFESFDLGI